MIHILQPLEVADSNTTSIAQHIGQELDASWEEDLLSFNCGWAIGSLDDEFAVEFVCVVAVDWFLEGGGDEDVAIKGI